jgi:hypothetical protein
MLARLRRLAVEQEIGQQGLLARLVDGRQQRTVGAELEAAQQLDLEHGAMNRSTNVNDRRLATFLSSQHTPAKQSVRNREHILASRALFVKQAINDFLEKPAHG